MFLSRNKKNNLYPCKPQFYYIKVGLKRVNIIFACFRDEQLVGKLNKIHHWKNGVSKILIMLCNSFQIQPILIISNFKTPE